MHRQRSIGRLASVLIGALVAIVLLHLDAGGGWIAAAVMATTAGAGATHGTRWYVTPAFTTSLVFLLLLYADPTDTRWCFDERLLETAIGVGLAYLFGLLLPALVRRKSKGGPPALRPGPSGT